MESEEGAWGVPLEDRLPGCNGSVDNGPMVNCFVT